MLTVDPKKRATLSEIRHHVWVNQGYSEPMPSYLKPRPVIVEQANARSLQELVSYGFKEDEAARILRTDMAPHPIVSLYHLIDEARRRQEAECEAELQAQQAAITASSMTCPPDLVSERKNSLATIASTEKPAIPVQMLVDVSSPPSPEPSKREQVQPQPQPHAHGFPAIQPAVMPNVVAMQAMNQTRLNFNAYFQKLAHSRKIPVSREGRQVEVVIQPPPPLVIAPAPPMPSSSVPLAPTYISPATTLVSAMAQPMTLPATTTTHRPVPDSIPALKPVVRAESPRSILPKPSPSANIEMQPSFYDGQAHDANEMQLMDDGIQRPVRGFFNIQTSSTRSVEEICCELERVLRIHDILFEKLNGNLYVCEDKTNRFEVEISKRPDMQLQPQAYDIFLRRLRGNVWTHKRICGRIIEQMRI